MRTRFAALAAGLALLPAAATAADHLDSPSVLADGRLDINDIYAFQSPDDSDNTVLIMTVNPAAGVMSPTTFNSRGTYEIMIDQDGDAVEDTTFRFVFSRARGNRPQRMIVLQDGRRIGRTSTGQTGTTRGGGRVTFGLYEDPFFFDLDGFNRFKEGEGGFDGTDFFAGLDVTAIVLEVPSDSITGDSGNIGVFARTANRRGQFDRMGRPGITTVTIPDGMKDAFNDDMPVNDPTQYADDIAGQLVDLFGVTRDYADGIAAVLTPDILTFDTASSDGFLNGRRLQDDVIDIELPLLSDGAVTTDMVDSNDAAFPGTFPFLAPPNGGGEED